MEKIDLSKLDKILSRYKGQAGALVPVLQEVQAEFGWVLPEAIEPIADVLKVFPSQVYGLLTFYPQFYLTPRGRNTIRVCHGTACHVQGANTNLRAVEHVLGIKEGETTNDFKVSLETATCLGKCFSAPAMMVNRNYYGKLLPNRVEAILKQYDQRCREV